MSAQLTAGQLAWMRAVMAPSLPRTCALSTPGASAVDEYGNTSNTPTTQANVRCSFMAAAGSERVLGGAVAQVGNYVLTFEAGVALTPRQSVAVAASADEPARTFQLVAPLDEPQMIGQRWLATEG
jgi:hypothetical protein